MTLEGIPRVTYSRRPYAFALVGVGLIVIAAWMNRGRLRPVGAGAIAPDFEVTDLEGNLARLSDHTGEVVMVNIWAHSLFNFFLMTRLNFNSMTFKILNCAHSKP